MTLGGPVTRDGARQEAHRELSDGIYGNSRPHWWNRLLSWIGDRIADLFDWILPHSGSGGGSRGLGVLALVVVLVVGAVALRWWLGPVRRTARARQAAADDLSSPLTAAQLRAEADRHAASEDYARAVRSRLRAIVRMLEEKGVLDPRPGRTAGELVAEVARIAPAADRGPAGPPATVPGTPSTDHDPAGAGPAGGGRAALAAAVEVFSEIWYGGRPATAAGYQMLVDADAALSRLRSGAGGRDGAAASLAVPA
ncbi:protein of unknown function (DUF4129) [Frankia torreyi]|uniref:Protein-glutamine gamma-glutamyltransferase-like C-terminal domain-containing protein n=1 Tax=Frankia torreyi TaxID=1856 RepID=A0A0D8BK41_9ACTN|nr:MULTISPECIES: DUF4129 domain-containing protein [Frankia]KJE23752.1 protein of unknown function (DUF4129) [Frankia torreyi]KQM05636.1 protein of unknown function (DUF4129) [Frankia sp. CpI1-P]